MSSEKQKIIQEFLKCPSNQTLLEEFKTTHSEKIKQKIDYKFKQYYQNYRIISYLIKVLHFESKHFDKKMRTHNHRYQLILTSDLENVSFSPINFEKSYSDSIDFSHDLADHISDDRLFNSFKKLTGRQREILSLVYIRQMTDKEIAQHLGITQQAVSKTRKNVIKKIRKENTHD